MRKIVIVSLTLISGCIDDGFKFTKIKNMTQLNQIRSVNTTADYIHCNSTPCPIFKHTNDSAWRPQWTVSYPELDSPNLSE